MSSRVTWFKYVGEPVVLDDIVIDLTSQNIPLNRYIWCNISDGALTGWEDIGIDEKVVYVEVVNGKVKTSTHRSIREGCEIQCEYLSGYYIMPVHMPLVTEKLLLIADRWDLDDYVKDILSVRGVLVYATTCMGKFKVCGLPAFESTLSRSLLENAVVRLHLDWGEVIGVVSDDRSRKYEFTVSNGGAEGVPKPIVKGDLSDGKYSTEICNLGETIQWIFPYAPTGRWLFRRKK